MTQPPAPVPDWLLTPAEAPGYGFVFRGRIHACTREALIEQCLRAPSTELVRTPETAGWVAPEEVPFLVAAAHAASVRQANRSLQRSAVALVAAILVYRAVHPAEGMTSTWFLLPGLAGLWLLSALYQRWSARSAGARTFTEARALVRHAMLASSRPPIYTRWMIGCLVVVALAEWMVGWDPAIEAAGLVKSAVRQGEWWRLFTGPMLHGGAFHLYMNGIALLVLGQVTEAYTAPAYLPIAFVVTAITGSLFSLWLLPGEASVGASGGLMGVIGFLVVLGFRHRTALPPGFVRALIVSVLLTAGLGLVGSQFIDNAGHLGGLVGGVVLGVLMLAGRREEPVTREGPALHVAGQVALAIVTLWAAISIGIILMHGR